LTPYFPQEGERKREKEGGREKRGKGASVIDYPRFSTVDTKKGEEEERGKREKESVPSLSGSPQFLQRKGEEGGETQAMRFVTARELAVEGRKRVEVSHHVHSGEEGKGSEGLECRLFPTSARSCVKEGKG